MWIVSCTRAEARQELLNLYEGYEHLQPAGWERMQAEAFEALRQLHLADMLVDAGPVEVTAGHTTYRIQEAA